MKSSIPSINLLKRDSGNYLDKFLGWALTIGRLVVIITEVIALAAFLYRFSLDRRLIDLHDVIAQKQAMVKYQKVNEDKYRNLQDRLNVISSLIDKGGQTAKLLTDVIDMAPEDFIFSSIAQSESDIIISADSRSLLSLLTFIKSVKQYPGVESVSLDSIQNRTSNSTVSVSLKISFKKNDNI
ncbi:MAG: hypothetical protein Q7K55_04200 [Candidatus Levybacteria bacterium]|nr:hypothetical protein [Candidatus Levybacteria bacterium]